MTMTVWKYPLEVSPKPQQIGFPLGALIRQVGVDPSEARIAIWAEVERGAERGEVRVFRVVPTGDDVPPGWIYVGTAISGPFVWHVYMEPLP